MGLAFDHRTASAAGYSVHGSHDQALTTRGVALDVDFGFEWFFASPISPGAGSGGYVGCEWGETARSSSPASGYHENTDAIQISTQRAVLMLGAYL